MTEWTEERLLTEFLLPGTEESQHLEYKAAAALASSERNKLEITKDVSAFANADGGVLVYGIMESQDKPARPERLDPVDAAQVPKEWLGQIVSTIAPRIPDVSVICVPLRQAEPNGCVYIVDVPSSPTAHQARDHKYYRRYNFENLSMPDHEVRNIMHRGTTPILEPHFSVSHPELDYGTCRSQALEIKVENKGPVAVHHLKLAFTFPNLDDLPFSAIVSGTKRTEIHEANRRIINIRGTRGPEPPKRYTGEWQISCRSTHVLFPQDVVDLSDIGFQFLTSEEILFIALPYLDKHSWTLWADNMPPRRGMVPLDDLVTYGGRRPSNFR